MYTAKFRQFSPTGIEIDVAAAAQAQSHTRRASLPAAVRPALPDQSFDVIFPTR